MEGEWIKVEAGSSRMDYTTNRMRPLRASRNLFDSMVILNRITPSLFGGCLVMDVWEGLAGFHNIWRMLPEFIGQKPVTPNILQYAV